MTQSSHNKPVQYEKGYVEFFKLKFLVDARVLIPRPETEILVEQVIRAEATSVVDIGTGSGCIAISIAKNLPECKVTAIDISPDALDVAKKNAVLNGVSSQIDFIESDLLSAFTDTSNVKFDIIATNLPYIPSSRILSLDSSVKDFEPHLALDGGEEGFELYRKLFVEMIQKNIYPLYFLGEIDITHSEIAKKEAEKYFPRAKVEVRNDLTKRPRFLVIQF
jgi:release factor glutamine methyltransferase